MSRRTATLPGWAPRMNAVVRWGCTLLAGVVAVGLALPWIGVDGVGDLPSLVILPFLACLMVAHLWLIKVVRVLVPTDKTDAAAPSFRRLVAGSRGALRWLVPIAILLAVEVAVGQADGRATAISALRYFGGGLGLFAVIQAVLRSGAQPLLQSRGATDPGGAGAPVHP